MSEDLEPIKKTQTEALKALADWCKWLITLETALSGGIIAIIATGNFAVLVGIALAAFFVSVVSASMLFGAIPDALQRVPIPAPASQSDSGGRSAGYDIYEFKMHGWFKLWALAGTHHVFALVGFFFLILFGLSKVDL